jgi:hypothetical protein
VFYTVFAKWQNFFKFSGYFGRKGYKQSGYSAVQTSVAEPHHFYAAPALGENFYAAPAPASTLLYSKAKF